MAELFEVIEQHDFKRLAELLAAGADPNLPHPEQTAWCPLASAIEELAEGGCIESVILLLRFGAAFDAIDPLRTAIPLLVAVLNRQLEAARILLACGANPNVRDDEGTVPLWLSVEQGDHAMAALLLLCGAEKSIYEWDCMSGMNALGRAAWRLDIPMIELLLKAGADPEVPDLDRHTAFERLPPRKESDSEKWDAAAALLNR